MIEKYGLQDNNHLHVMWNARHQWVPIYFRDTFFAEMTTSQRSESMNALAKMWVSSRYDKEDEADFRSRDGESSLWSHNLIEIQARSVYTKRVFSEFKNQFRCTTGYDLTELENNYYKISTIQNSTLPAQGINSFIVTSSLSMEKRYSCRSSERLSERSKGYFSQVPPGFTNPPNRTINRKAAPRGWRVGGKRA
ncbi:Protein FAR1-RELATED SEQUENCE 5 [Ananas comosus]|uniref:Protein FAR1-RELATED SEQUENCE n=1 Tax=Ananas comosus TaxID=4615 RepID=A0A199UDE0_ANACO|nr:Protein FAR1-RELATED SEQUENCE 5 [Ananas comosus]